MATRTVKKFEGKPIRDFQGARDARVPLERLEEVRLRARRFRDRMKKGSSIRYYRTFDLVRVPYPTRYGLWNAFHRVYTPFMHIINRLFVVQYETRAGAKTLLFSPSDFVRNAETPFFKRLAGMFGPFQKTGQRLIAPFLATVEECLEETGIRPEQVDYISYDHLHTQDIRRWLGTPGEPALFPNARLLVMKQEWQSVQGLLPTQADWYCPQGCEGIHPEKIVQLSGSTMLGEGVALIHTPGHTEGNHSLVVNTPAGLLVTSENGVSADNYAPFASRIKSVRSYAEHTGSEVILNGNTKEGAVDQYISMVLEKEVAGPAFKDPDYFNVIPSSEMSAYWAFPGIRPSFSFGPLEFGEPIVSRRKRTRERRAA